MNYFCNRVFYPYSTRHPEPCRIINGILGGNTASVVNNQVDLESFLKGQACYQKSDINHLKECKIIKEVPVVLPISKPFTYCAGLYTTR